MKVCSLLLLRVICFTFALSINCMAGEQNKVCLDQPFQWNEYWELQTIRKDIEALIPHNVDFNCLDKYGETLLMALIPYDGRSNGTTEIYGGTSFAELFEVIFRNGGDIFIRDKNGKTALQRVPPGWPEIRAILESSEALAKKYGSIKKAYLTKDLEQNKLTDQNIKKLNKFRKLIQLGDDTNYGVVVEVKGSLVKIQTNDSQCSQRDYDGNCKNWINTPVEKWFKRSEVYPQ